ncbi:hypothetical protein GE09DRAFT_1063280 [Coniochaeta sp. 2T2.1]|nr:hypothetical protein GE09DRAFT_1063280 [Coniochaeta sp. 2T2.1]
MEASPLIKAHDHAKAASDATRSSDSTVAVDEHALAAGEFSNAAKNTGSIEALRTLRLLEQHHKKLSELLKLPYEQTSQQSTESDIVESDEKQTTTADDGKEKKTASAGRAGRSSSPVATKTLPTLSHQQRRYPARDMSSSIASNLASARGIRTARRGQALTPSVSNDLAPGSIEVHPRRDGGHSKTTNKSEQPGKPSWVPPSAVAPSKPEPQQTMEPVKEEEPSPNPSDEGFSRFYSTFGSIFNKLSAPLAFAGLPLITEESASESAPATAPEPPSQRRQRSRPPHSATIEPDLSKIYSKATLRALRGDHGPNDSFYVVPTSGHTASYASILTFDQKERRRIAASIHGGDAENLADLDEDDFVDARESQVPLSPALRKRLGNGKSAQNLANTVEELHLENQSLKEMLDKLSKRLHAFEINSQSSHLALAQSLRFQRPGSPMSSSGGGSGKAEPVGGGGVEEALRQRNRELEEQMALTAQRMEVLEQDYAKLQQTVEKYRDRWEKLKAGAKARREGQGSKEGAVSGASR